jgi:hypothetical protein
MLKLRKEARLVDGEFVMLNVPPRIKEAFDLVNLKEYVNSFYAEKRPWNTSVRGAPRPEPSNSPRKSSRTTKRNQQRLRAARPIRQEGKAIRAPGYVQLLQAAKFLV